MKLKKKERPCIRSAAGNDYTLMGKLWIEGREGTFLGHGRIALLERIKQYGSISEAARSMEMSYRHAWALLENMNRQARLPLIETAIGGEKGGGTRLTETGEKAIAFFKELDKKFERFLSMEAKRFDF
ncbi:MAG: LysR family transcriptional regulator [Actinomycetota bacterium]|nr:LysR family transcriptional regulator [Actinomycetota bacterium]